MSYDLVFAAAPAGDQPADADESSGQAGLTAELWQRVVDRAVQLLGRVQATRTDAFCEMDHEATGIQLVLSAGSGTMTVAYGATGNDAAKVLHQMYALGVIVEEETGLVGYDPQMGQPLRQAIEDLTKAQASFDLVGDMLRRQAATQRRAAIRRGDRNGQN